MLHVLIIWCLFTILVVPYGMILADDEMPVWFFPWFVIGAVLFMHALRGF